MARNIEKEIPVKEEVSKEIMDNELDSLINNYFEANTAKNSYTKSAKEKNDKIKEILIKKGLTEFKGSKHTVKLISSESISYDDVKLLELVKQLPDDYRTRLIDLVETVNLEKLEREIVMSNLKAEQFKDAEVRSTTYKLNIK